MDSHWIKYNQIERSPQPLSAGQKAERDVALAAVLNTNPNINKTKYDSMIESLECYKKDYEA